MPSLFCMNHQNFIICEYFGLEQRNTTAHFWAFLGEVFT